MSITKDIIQPVSNFFFLITFYSLLLNYCSCINEESFNITAGENGFATAVATWYGSPEGAGSGGACGFENDVAGKSYKAMISAGNNNLFKAGFGCGSCYQVRCTKSAPCSGSPITVTITDECPGACNNEPFHFDLSGTAFGALAKPGQASALRKFGRIEIDYQRVPCSYPGTFITFKVDIGSNPNYFACAIEYVGGDGALAFVELQPAGWKQWLPMEHSWGATWKIGITPGKTNPPFSIKMTTAESKRIIVAQNVIPVNWAPGKYYQSRINSN